VSRNVLYVSSNSQLSKLFANALKPLGYDRFDYLPEFWRAMKKLKDEKYGLIILHGPLPGLTFDAELVDQISEVSSAPIFLVAWDEDLDLQEYDHVEIVPSPLTAAALTQAVARYRKPREDNLLLTRLLEAPGFRTFSEGALIHLLSGSSAVQVDADDTLFEEGAKGDSMYFVLAGIIGLYLGDRELEKVESGGIFGEMAMLERQPREARAAALETAVLLQVKSETLRAADQEFRAIFFELATRVLVRRLRSTNTMLRGN
jgi:CRP-like cAMP-binding protein